MENFDKQFNAILEAAVETSIALSKYNNNDLQVRIVGVGKFMLTAIHGMKKQLQDMIDELPNEFDKFDYWGKYHKAFKGIDLHPRFKETEERFEKIAKKAERIDKMLKNAGRL